MSADRSEVVPSQHWSLLLRSARCSPFRLRPDAGHDVGRNRSCSAVLLQHFIHVLPGREHFSEASPTTCARRPRNAPVLNRTKSKIVNFCTTAEGYRYTFRSPRPRIHRRTSARMRNLPHPPARRPCGHCPSTCGTSPARGATRSGEVNKTSIHREAEAGSEPKRRHLRALGGPVRKRPGGLGRRRSRCQRS